jgi:hypothetical protein
MLRAVIAKGLHRTFVHAVATALGHETSPLAASSTTRIGMHVRLSVHGVANPSEIDVLGEAVRAS